MRSTFVQRDKCAVRVIVFFAFYETINVKDIYKSLSRRWQDEGSRDIATQANEAW